ncbi:MAG TPA: dihydropteroate synthase [Solirubrobacteraceae bacterium]|jgi:dihydropteroate synthase
MRIKAAGQSLELAPRRALVMGIVNVGDDSVADELELSTLPQQLEQARRLLEAGAAIIDIGAQSGRTDTPIIAAEQEIAQLTPIVKALAAEGVVVSVDTWRAKVASAAIEAGAAIVNDVSGLADPEMASLIARTGAALVLMHTRAAPKVRNFPGYEDPVHDVAAMLEELVGRAKDAGIASEQLILDPGLDFAKTPQESIEVLRRLGELHRFGLPLLLAVSRKYFIGMLTNRQPGQRLAGTLAAIAHGVDAGAQIVRVHDVAEVVDFLAVRDALRSEGPATLLGDPDAESLKWIPPKSSSGSL